MIISWAFNDKCNKKCEYCFVGDHKYRELSFEQKCKIIDKMKMDFPDTHNLLLYFFGKEVLYDEEMFLLLDYMKSTWNRMPNELTFVSNGINLQKYRKEILSHNFNRFRISHDPGTDLPNLSGFIGKCKIEVIENVCKNNAEDVIYEVEHLLNDGVSITINPIIPKGDAKTKNDLVMTDDEYNNFCKRLIPKLIKGETTLKIPMYYRNLAFKASYDPNINDHVWYEPDFICLSWYGSLFIRCDGMAFGCAEAGYEDCINQYDYLSMPINEIMIKASENKVGTECQNCKLIRNVENNK